MADLPRIHSPGAKAPVAIVALGDPSHRDEALPARVIGRARTMLAEIGRLRWRDPDSQQLSLGLEGSLALAIDPALEPDAGPVVEWIEAQGASSRLDAVLSGRRRVVIVDTLSLEGKPGAVYHWHLERGGVNLGWVQHYHRSPRLGLEHLAFWLEDDVPSGGLDLIGIEPGDTTDGEGLSASVKRRLPTISSQVTAVLVRILAEEGW